MSRFSSLSKYILVICIFASFEASAQSLPNAIATSATRSTSEVPGFSNDRFNKAFQNDLNRVDPEKDGWNSEAFNEMAMRQLKRLGKIMEGKESLASKHLGIFANPKIQCDLFLPTAFNSTFQDDNLAVNRSENSSKNFNGHDGLSRNLQQFRARCSGKESHAHFKIIRVLPTADGIQTVAFFEFGGERDEARFQMSAQWTCDWIQPTADQDPKIASIRISNYEQVITKKQQPTILQDKTDQVLAGNASYREQMIPGLDHWGSMIDRHMGIDIVGIHGIALGDVDNDGLDDLFLCEPGGLPNRLYLHKPNGQARDISAVSGVDFLEATRSALFLDLDNDGDQDLVVGSDRFVIMLQNDGYGRFAQRAAFRTSSAIVSMAAADYDLDGDLDLYVCGYFMKEDAADSAIGLGNPIPFHDANNGARNSFYQNDGNWQFKDVTNEVGLDEDNLRFSLAAAWQDYDNDGDFDLYVANDYGRNCLYQNTNGKFKNVAAQAGVEDISAGMSVSWGDYNRDGLWDIYVSNMFSSAGNRISYHRQFKPGEQQETIESYQRFAHGNTLFENTGDGTFKDVTDAAGVTLGRWAWGSNFVDINNDGWQDLFVTNGMLTRQDPNDL